MGSIHFNYAARDTGGSRLSGEIVAVSVEEALAALQEIGVYVTQIEPAVLGERGRGRQRVVLSAGEKSFLLESWSRLVEAGLPMDGALNALQALSVHLSVRGALRKILWLMRDGTPLSEAVEHSGLLPPTWAGILEAGEKRGDVLGPLLVLQKRSDQIRRTIQELLSILLVPSILLLLIFAWIWVFVAWLAPVMAQSVKELSGSSSAVLKALSGLTTVTLPATLFAALALGVLVLVILRGNRADSVLGVLPSRVTANFPVIGPLISKIHLILVSSELQLQLEAGIPIMTALVTLSRAVPKGALRRQLEGAYREIWSGTPVWQSLGGLPMMPVQAQGLLAAGHISGKLPELLGMLAREAILDLETQARRLAITLRGFSVLMSGVIVGLLTISIFLVILSAFDDLARLTALSLMLIQT